MYQDFVQRVKKKKVWSPGDKVIIAVSGGVDSIVLLDMVSRLPETLKPEIIVAHVDHQLREVSAEEAVFVKELAAKYTHSVHIHKWETHPRSGLEQAAREIRYAFFRRLAKDLQCTTVLTAHHKDDQVETVLMRFVRGNSLDELKGIASVRQEKELKIVRLLLPYSKSELISYAREHHLDWREDETNKSIDYTRNRYRNTIIPLLKNENPAVEDHIIRFSEEITSVLQLITPFIEEKRNQTIVLSDHKLTIDRNGFLALDSFVQEKVLASALKEWAPDKGFLLKQKHLTLCRKWLESSGPNATLDLPNDLIAVRSYDRCFIQQTGDDQFEDEDLISDATLKAGQWIYLEKGRKLGLCSYADYRKREQRTGEQYLYLDLDESELPLIVRHRTNGDKIRVKGLNGSKKLKDLFIDQKVPLQERNKAWVVTDNKGEILWVIDYKESALSLDPRTDTISYVLVCTDKNNSN